VAIRWNGSTLVGFENHGGRTYLGTAKPLGKVLKGYGNNAQDRTEGAVYRNAYGTYLHGSLLPKNPHFADHLIELALRRTYRISDLPSEERNGSTQSSSKRLGVNEDEPVVTEQSQQEHPQRVPLQRLDDRLEWEAHASLLERMGLYTEAVAAWRAHNREEPL